MSAEQLDLTAIRAKLAASGPQYWRSLEAVAETPEFKEFLHREFPANASEFNDPVGRRNFLKLMSASLAPSGSSVIGWASSATVGPTLSPYGFSASRSNP